MKKFILTLTLSLTLIFSILFIPKIIKAQVPSEPLFLGVLQYQVQTSDFEQVYITTQKLGIVNDFTLLDNNLDSYFKNTTPSSYVIYTNRKQGQYQIKDNNDNWNNLPFVEFDLILINSTDFVFYKAGSVVQSISIYLVHGLAWTYTPLVDSDYNSGFNNAVNIYEQLLIDLQVQHEAELQRFYNAGKVYGQDIGELIGYNTGYSEGYNIGLNDNINTQEAYNAGKLEGIRLQKIQNDIDNQEVFELNLHKWIVPAIISTLIIGGVLYMRKERN